MTNTLKLKAKLAEYGLSQTTIAEMIGISYQAFNNKLNNRMLSNGKRAEFKVSEIEPLCKLLNIKDKDSYFFYN